MVNLDNVVLPAPEDRKPSILIVEDEPMIRLALSDFLQECGFVVLGVGNAAEAITVIETNNFAIDVVLTDVRMPGEMDGFGLARWIRNHRPGLPVLITTGDKAKLETAEDLCEKNPIIEKPHDFKIVLARVRAAIDGAGKTSEASD
jgi:DNA-binding response OmpR family regulator